ncbi:MAG: hypothetical protein KAJ19_21410 [Gammaproteobacteria bacterium]|nr:hypothetical protein [Gammaproteobacteria bacterium]
MTKKAASKVTGSLLVKVGSFEGRQIELSVPSLQAASKAVVGYIDDEELGSRDWHGGDVRYEDNDDVIAVVSYNGRVWGAKPVEGESRYVPDGELEYELDG